MNAIMVKLFSGINSRPLALMENSFNRLTRPPTSGILASSGQARRGGRLLIPPGPKGSNGTELSPGAADILLRYFYFNHSI